MPVVFSSQCRDLAVATGLEEEWRLLLEFCFTLKHPTRIKKLHNQYLCCNKYHATSTLHRRRNTIFLKMKDTYFLIRGVGEVNQPKWYGPIKTSTVSLTLPLPLPLHSFKYCKNMKLTKSKHNQKRNKKTQRYHNKSLL